jgi:hypothetical protein
MLFMDAEQYGVKVPGCFPVQDSVQRMAVVNYPSVASKMQHVLSSLWAASSSRRTLFPSFTLLILNGSWDSRCFVDVFVAAVILLLLLLPLTLLLLLLPLLLFLLLLLLIM